MGVELAEFDGFGVLVLTAAGSPPFGRNTMRAIATMTARSPRPKMSLLRQ